MTALGRLRRARVRLAGAVLVGAVGWAAATGLLVAMLCATAGRFTSWPGLATRAPVFTVAVALVTLLVMLWRRRALRSITAVALWIEERQPELQFALVTAVDPRIVATGVPRDLADRASAAEIESVVSNAARRLVVRGLIAVLVAGSVWVVLRRVGLAIEDHGRGKPATALADAPNRLVPLVARVDPPAYARLAAVQVKEPATIEGLVGSAITLSGRGAAQGITTLVGADSAGVRTSSGGWSSSFPMPAVPGVVTLRDRSYRRLVVLAPRPDSAPAVVLTAPSRDTTYQTMPSAPIVLEARATDDLGLATGYFEYLISSGSGEHFETVTRTSPRVALGLRRGAQIRSTLALDTLRLTPGSVVNIRAVMLDANDVSGPGKGVSETRTIRLAEPRDSAAVEAAPPDQLDSMLVSQRLLNLRTDTLLRTRAKLTRAAVADRSMSYSNVQESIRLRVVAVISLLEDDGVGGTAPTDVSRLLRTAAGEMQSARIDLATAAPDRARPHMRQALKILDQIRNAHRYYLRGRTPPVLVDLERVRLQGKATSDPAARRPRERLDAPDVLLAERVERAARLFAVTPEAALDSLTFIRVAALVPRPDVSRALGRAIEQLRAGGGFDASVAPVRRLLSGAAKPIAGPMEWLGWTRQ